MSPGQPRSLSQASGPWEQAPLTLGFMLCGRGTSPLDIWGCWPYPHWLLLGVGTSPGTAGGVVWEWGIYWGLLGPDMAKTRAHTSQTAGSPAQGSRDIGLNLPRRAGRGLGSYVGAQPSCNGNDDWDHSRRPPSLSHGPPRTFLQVQDHQLLPMWLAQPHLKRLKRGQGSVLMAGGADPKGGQVTGRPVGVTQGLQEGLLIAP